MADVAKTIIVAGIILVVVGVVLLLMQKLPFAGKLPGDIVIKKDNFTLYFPLGLSIILSIIISLVLYLLGKFK